MKIKIRRHFPEKDLEKMMVERIMETKKVNRATAKHLLMTVDALTTSPEAKIERQTAVSSLALSKIQNEIDHLFRKNSEITAKSFVFSDKSTGINVEIEVDDKDIVDRKKFDKIVSKYKKDPHDRSRCVTLNSEKEVIEALKSASDRTELKESNIAEQRKEVENESK